MFCYSSYANAQMKKLLYVEMVVQTFQKDYIHIRNECIKISTHSHG